MPRHNAIVKRDYDGAKLWPLKDLGQNLDNILKSVNRAVRGQREYICSPDVTYTIKRIARVGRCVETIEKKRGFDISDLTTALEKIDGDDQYIKILNGHSIFFLFRDNVPGYDFDEFVDDDDYSIPASMEASADQENALLYGPHAENRQRYLASLMSTEERRAARAKYAAEAAKVAEQKAAAAVRTTFDEVVRPGLQGAGNAYRGGATRPVPARPLARAAGLEL